MSNTLLAAQTAAATPNFIVGNTPVTIGAVGLAGAETVALEIELGGTWVAALDNSGTAITLTVARHNRMIGGANTGPGKYRLNKGVTAGATSLHRHRAVER